MNALTISQPSVFSGEPDNYENEIDYERDESTYPVFKAVRGKSDALEEMAVNFLNELFKLAMDNGVSDVHLESLDVGNVCRLRKDGVLHQWGRLLTANEFTAICKKIYSRANIDPNSAKTRSIDTRSWLKFGSKRLDLRISSVPTLFGVTIVFRLLDQSNSGRKITDIECTDAVLQSMLRTLTSANGIILLTGPTGSGKTSTLYAMLNHINNSGKKVFTIEDPVEYAVKGVQHVMISDEVTYASALKSALRQDPDIILLGEIRDRETAKAAISAAQTGHLVLSTLHTNDSISAFSRLIELGIDPTHINETVIAVSAQRLVRKCKETRNVDKPNDFDANWLRQNGYSHLTKKTFGRGYEASFYEGRIPVIEYLMMTDEIRECISTNSIHKVYDLAKKQAQFETLTDAALRLAESGLTSLEQVQSISRVRASNSMEGMLLADRLLALGYITEFQLQYAKEVVRSSSALDRKPLKQVLFDLHFCSLEQLNEVGDAPDA